MYMVYENVWDPGSVHLEKDSQTLGQVNGSEGINGNVGLLSYL